MHGGLKKTMKMWVLGLVVVGALVLSGTARAATVGFTLRPESPRNDITQTLEAIGTLSMEVTTSLPDQVRFQFTISNNVEGLADSFIASIFFEDFNSLFSTVNPVFETDDLDIEYTVKVVTGKGSKGFSFVPDFTAESLKNKDSLDPGHYLGITLTLNSGKSLSDVWKAFRTNTDNAGPVDLAVGIHVQGLSDDDGGSVKLENNPVPVPATAWLLGVGLLGLLGLRRRND